jgi:hypothetical protein
LARVQLRSWALRFGNREHRLVVMVIISEELLAERWFCSVSRILRWRSENIGPAYLKMGGRILYRVSDIEAYEQYRLVIP